MLAVDLILNEIKIIDMDKNKKLLVKEFSPKLFFFEKLLLNPRLSNISIGIKK